MSLLLVHEDGSATPIKNHIIVERDCANGDVLQVKVTHEGVLISRIFGHEAEEVASSHATWADIEEGLAALMVTGEQ